MIARVMFGVVLAVQAAHADVAVRVVDVAADRVYVEPGEQAGLRVGTRVELAARTFVVVELNAKTAALQPEDAASRGMAVAIAIGAAGTARPIAPRAPRDAAAFRGQWPAATPPGTRPASNVIPLGGSNDDGRSRVTVIASGFAAAGQDDRRASGELRLMAAFQTGRVGADVDVAGRIYNTDWNSEEHIPVLLRAATLRWGPAIGTPRHSTLHAAANPGLAIALGRLRHAATAVGALDGARTSFRIGDLELAAFGGLVPDLLGGSPGPETHARRFGAELIWDAADIAWQPRLAITALASTWEGVLDERRLLASGSLSRGRVWLDGFVEAQAFSDDNNFGDPVSADKIELTGAGTSVGWRSRDGAHAGAGIALLRPEQTGRIIETAELPLGWLCVIDNDRCIGGDRSITASASAGLRRTAWSIDAVATVGHTRGFSFSEPTPQDPRQARSAVDASGYLRGELSSSSWRAFVAPSAGRTDFADWGAVEIGGGARRGVLDVSASYRPELLAERWGKDVVLHSLVGELRWTASSAIDLGVFVLGTFGDDRDLLAALATLTWRAR